MASKVYTAQELLDTANHIYADYGVARIPISGTNLTYKDVRGWEIAAMLRQAAEAMERDGKHKSCKCCDALKQIACHVREAQSNGMEIFSGLKDMILNICREYIDKCDG